MTQLPKIGRLQPENPFFLAPMEAVNCASFRLLCRRRGAALVFTDMIDADQFMDYANEHSPDKAIQKYINPQEDEKPLAIQLGGADIDNLKACYSIIKKHAALIDFNIGCPLGYLLGKKGGAYLMKHSDQLEKLLKALRQHITLPLTLKIRSGWDKDSINAIDIARQAEKRGIDMITIHPRTRKQAYRDKADWELARKVKQAINIPLALSGDVFNTHLAHQAFRKTGCDFIMLARAAKVNPSIFTQMLNYCANEKNPKKPVSVYQKIKVNPYHDFEEFLHLYKEREHRYRFSELKDHALWTATECRDNKRITQKILKAEKEHELISILKKIRF